MTAFGKRLLTSIGLSVFFLLVYGAGQFAAAHRAFVPSVYFAWETQVPFVAVLILPYLSIDLFFVTAPFLIRSDRALRAYALRIVIAIATAGIGFVVWPLKFAFHRPPVAGPIGFLFQQFQRADPPFNQLPSLHVALLMIVGDVFLRQTRGVLRVVLITWFTMIAASPLLVYQHHVVDLIAGFGLGLLCLHLIPDDGDRQPFERNVRVGIYYAAAAGALVFLCIWIGRFAWPLWWPATSLGVVSVGYFSLGPVVYRKRDGRFSWTTCLLWPNLLGQRASLWWYARNCRPMDAVTGNLWIGRRPNRRGILELQRVGVTAVVDLTSEFSTPQIAGISYLYLPTLDLTAPMPDYIDSAVKFIHEHTAIGIVFVHCKVGYSRSAVIVAAYLIATGSAESADAAIEMIRTARPTLIVRPEAQRAIETFAARGTLDRATVGTGGIL